MTDFIFLDDFLAQNSKLIAKGPVAVLLIEDDVAVSATLQHSIDLGFKSVLALSPEPISFDELDDEAKARIHNVRYDSRQRDAHVEAVNKVIKAVPPKTWMYYAFNAEFLYFPFAESRSVGELLTFHSEERRDAMLTYVVDLYASDLEKHPDGIDLEAPYFDKTGYYALGRQSKSGEWLERQFDFHGGLRWRFEEYLPYDRRRIDRIALFRTTDGLELQADHRFNIEEYNTYACPWHHNLTAAIASFRVAKALRRNPGSRDAITNFTWRNSHRFDWTSQQLMDLGLMEPGQWF